MSGIGSNTATSPFISSLLSGSGGTLDLDDIGPTPSASNNYTEDSNGKTINLKLNDTIYLQLNAQIDQGYLWNITVTDGLNITKTNVYPPTKANINIGAGTIGLTAVQEWDIQAIKPGTQKVTGVYKSGNSTVGVKTYELTINVS